MNLWEQLERAGAPAARARGRPLAAFHVTRGALALLLAGLTYALFPASPAVEIPVLDVGSVAPDNVIAPFAYSVPKPTAQVVREREEASRGVTPVFSLVHAALDSVRADLASFGAALDAATAPGRDDGHRAAAVTRVAAARGIRLTAAEAAYLAAPTRRAALLAWLGPTLDSALAAGVASNGATDSVATAARVRGATGETEVARDAIATFPSLVGRVRATATATRGEVAGALAAKIVGAVFHPTLVADRVATARRRDDARRAVREAAAQVRTGEKIVGAHEVVGREEFDKMRALRDQLQGQHDREGLVGRFVGAVLFNALVIALFGVTLLLFRPQLYASLRALAVMAAAFFLVVAAAAAIARAPAVHPELIPIAVVAVVFSVLFDARISMIAAMVLAVLIGGQSVYRGTNALFINLIGGVAAAFSARVIRRRTEAVYPVAAITTAYTLGALAIGLTLGQPLDEISRVAAWGALNAVASVALALVLLPAAEEVTGIDTYPKLLEWSDLNRPLMRRLSLEAPGTYHHTIAMANLAEAACNAIGANGLLARVGAYYHDIGKLRKPQYFSENQPRGRNPHDRLKPGTSATIIRNHVREGLELADEYRVPKAIRSFITEHHGTGPISYFFEKAKERDGGAVTGDFVYPGPIPQTVETAVCMLADGVEASTRVIADPTPQKIRDVVDHIVRQRMDQGQLRDAPLTLRQLELVKDQFVRMLVGQHHNRIDYPSAGGGVTSEFASA